jgi:hypothetical protein
VISTKADKRERHLGFQIVAGLYSLIFFGSVASGYFYLFKNNPVIAGVVAAIFALLAWFLAKMIGNSEGGIKTQKPLFGLLLVISAYGIFNALLLNLEGEKIFVETITDAQDNFRNVQAAAERETAKVGIDKKIKGVRNLEAALYSEINHPIRCGQGPAARQILASLQQQLPDFIPLSNTRVDCSQNEKVIADYKQRIGDLIVRAPWNNADLSRVITESRSARDELETLKITAASGLAPNLIKTVTPKLEALDTRYRSALETLSRQVDTTNLKPRLELSSVESLGDWSQLINIIIDRISKPTTWIYLLLAGFADWMMVHLFTLVRQHKTRTESGVAGTPTGRGW